MFKKDEPKSENDSDYEDIEKKNYAFKEGKSLVDQDWDPDCSEFKTVGKVCIFLIKSIVISCKRKLEVKHKFLSF